MKKFASLLKLAENASDEDIEKALIAKLEADNAAAEKTEAVTKTAVEQLTAELKSFGALKEEFAKLQAERKADRVALFQAILYGNYEKGAVYD